MKLTQKFLKLSLLIAGALVLGLTPARAVPFTLSDGTPGSFFSSGWNQGVVAQVALPTFTTTLTSLSSTAIAYDQGWGGYDPNNNQVYIGLFSNSSLLSWVHVAGGVRNGYVANQYAPQTFSANAGQLAAFNSALSGINWSLNPNVTMQMATAALGYPGWTLTVQNASFSVSGQAGAVPDGGTTLIMMGLALAGLVAVRRKLSLV